MRITNTTAGDITINYRNGVAVTIPAGKYVVRPSSDLDYLDDTKVTLALFASGALVLANDDGSAWSGSALPSVPASPAGPKPLMVTSSAQGVVVGADRLRGRRLQSTDDWMFLRPSGPLKRFYVPSPYGAYGAGGVQGYVVHSSICWVPGGFAGYEYWLDYTPLPTGENRKENPCIAATNNINAVNWDLPPGANNPLVEAPDSALSYNRDTDISYFEGIGIVVLFNERGDGTAPNNYNSLKVLIFDGVAWSPAATIWRGKMGASNVGDMASPSLSYDASTGLYWIYGHNADDLTNKKLRRMSSSSLLSGWPDTPEDCTYTPAPGRKWWHSQIRRLPGGMTVGFVQDNNNDSGAGHLYVVQSIDGINFESGLVSDLSGYVNANGFHYRPSWFAWERDGKIGATVIYSHLNVPHFERQDYEIVSQRESRVREYRRIVDAVAQAKIGGTRGLFAADDFFRADTTAGLGTTLNGLTWTNQDANTWGIVGNTAYNTTTGNCVAWIDTGKTAYSVSAQLAQNGTQSYLVVARLDATHCWRFGCEGPGLRLHQYNGAMQPEIGAGLGIAVKATDIFRVDVSGQSARFYLNGQLIYEANGTVAVSGKIALQASGATATKWAAISVTDLE